MPRSLIIFKVIDYPEKFKIIKKEHKTSVMKASPGGNIEGCQREYNSL
jgi:hypothetical protein